MRLICCTTDASSSGGTEWQATTRLTSCVFRTRMALSGALTSTTSCPASSRIMPRASLNSASYPRWRMRLREDMSAAPLFPVDARCPRCARKAVCQDASHQASGARGQGRARRQGFGRLGQRLRSAALAALVATNLPSLGFAFHRRPPVMGGFQEREHNAPNAVIHGAIGGDAQAEGAVLSVMHRHFARVQLLHNVEHGALEFRKVQFHADVADGPPH